MIPNVPVIFKMKFNNNCLNIHRKFLRALHFIKEHALIELTLRDQQLFADCLLKDTAPSQRLLKAAKRHKKFVQEEK